MYHISNTLNKICDTKYYTSKREYRKKFYQSKSWGIYRINNYNAYIIEGNHRSVIAKFLSKANLIPNEIIIPYVIDMYCNLDELNKYRSFKERIKNIKNEYSYIEYISIDTKKKSLSKDDFTETFSISYSLHLGINNIRKNKEFSEVDTLVSYMEKQIEKYKPRPFYSKMYYYLERYVKYF